MVLYHLLTRAWTKSLQSIVSGFWGGFTNQVFTVAWWRRPATKSNHKLAARTAHHSCPILCQNLVIFFLHLWHFVEGRPFRPGIVPASDFASPFFSSPGFTQKNRVGKISSPPSVLRNFCLRILQQKNSWSEFRCTWARPGDFWVFEMGSNEFMRLKNQHFCWMLLLPTQCSLNLSSTSSSCSSNSQSGRHTKQLRISFCHNWN